MQRSEAGFGAWSRRVSCRALNARIARVAVLVSLPQLPFWASQSVLAFFRPVFNLDLLLAVAIATVAPRLGAAALALAWLAEVARIVALDYHFASLLELFAAARFVQFVSLYEILSWKLVLGAGALIPCGWLTLRVARGGRWLGAGVLAAAVLLVLLDMANGSGHMFGLGSDRFRWGVNVAGSPIWNILQAERALRSSDVSLTRFDGAVSHDRLASLAAGAMVDDRSVLLVVVESMGLPRAPSVEAWLAEQVDTPRLRRRYRVERSNERFSGTTTYGELRVLCGLRGHYSRLSREAGRHCVPQAFRDQGWQVLGLHGFGFDMFDRKAWWPLTGLSPQPMAAAHPSTGQWACNYAFPGWCDRAVLREAVHLTQAPRRFVYALTLDTHLPLPLDRREGDMALRELCRREHVSNAACDLVAALGDVLRSLESELVAAPTPPYVVVVGDHSPPFVSSSARDAFSSREVPVLWLAPLVDGGAR